MLLALLASRALAYDVLVLVDGQELEGEVVLLEAGTYQLTLGGGLRLVFDPLAVREVRYDVPEESLLPAPRPGRPPSPPGMLNLHDDLEDDPGATRNLVGRSAWTLGNLSGFVGQEELILTTVGLGLGPYVDVVASSVVPVAVSPYAANYCLDLKFGVPLASRNAMAVGAHFTGLGESAWTSLYGVVSLGKRSRHVSLGGGGIYSHVDQSASYFLSATWQHRVGPLLGLVSENWLVVRAPDTQGADVVFVPGFATRLYTRRVSFDLGLVPFDTAVFSGSTALVPLPWFSVHYNWRGKSAEAKP